MSDPKHTFSIEDDGSVRIEMPSGVGVDVDARGTTRLAVNYTTLGRRMVNCVVAALQQSSSGITAGAEKSTQVVDSGAAGPTRTGDLLITNQGAETAETLGNQQDTSTSAPAEGAKVAQGESSTCEGVTAGLRPPANRIRRALSGDDRCVQVTANTGLRADGAP